LLTQQFQGSGLKRIDSFDCLGNQTYSYMKRITLFSIGLLSMAAANAQLNKGRVFLGGSLSTSTTENTTISTPNNVTKQQALVVDPTIGFFVKDNLVVGINAGYSSTETTSTGGSKIKQSSIAPGIFARKYYGLGKNFYFYGHGGLQYVHTSQEAFTGSATLSKATGNGVTVTAYPGVAYALRKHFLLEVSLRNLFTAGYSSSETKNTAGTVTSKNNNFNLGINGGGGIPLSIGFNILFGK
jgi:outer membrane protein W